MDEKHAHEALSEIMQNICGMEPAPIEDFLVSSRQRGLKLDKGLVCKGS